jgi:hypothetical protein
MEGHSEPREESVGSAWQQETSSTSSVVAPASASALRMTFSSLNKTTHVRGLLSKVTIIVTPPSSILTVIGVYS